MGSYEELETKWKKYNMKRRLKIYTLPTLIVIAGFAGYYLLFDYMNSPRHKAEPIIIAQQTTVPQNEINKTKETIKQENNLTEVVAAIKDEAQQQLEAPAATEAPKQDENMTLKKKECYFVNADILNIRSQPTTESRVLGKLRYGENICPLEVITDWVKIDSGWVYSRNLLPMDRSANEAPIEQKRAVVIIEHADISDKRKVEILKDRLEVSPNAATAIEVSELYYRTEDFKESLKWALNANDLDKENESSWLLFAKSSFKLGQKERAISALREYVQRSGSENAKSLLEKIENNKLD